VIAARDPLRDAALRPRAPLAWAAGAFQPVVLLTARAPFGRPRV